MGTAANGSRHRLRARPACTGTFQPFRRVELSCDDGGTHACNIRSDGGLNSRCEVERCGEDDQTKHHGGTHFGVNLRRRERSAKATRRESDSGRGEGQPPRQGRGEEGRVVGLGARRGSVGWNVRGDVCIWRVRENILSIGHEHDWPPPPSESW